MSRQLGGDGRTPASAIHAPAPPATNHAADRPGTVHAADRPATVHAPAWPAATGDRMLASDADRDSAADLLNEAFAQGRLTQGEHGDRVQAAYNARTWTELNKLTADLPTQHGALYRRPAAGPLPAGPDRCLLCTLLVLCPPAGITWLLVARRRARGRLHRAGDVRPALVPAGDRRRAENR